jgi:DNA repair protein RecO (recombination protein O)
MSRFKIEAFVIRATRMAESSRVVTLFSKEMGKVKAVAKGIGRPKSKMSGTVELFNQIEGVLYKKETSELGTLGSAAVLEAYSQLTADPRKFGFGSAWCEVLDKTSHPDQPRPEIFELTLEMLPALEDSDAKLSGQIFWSGLVKLLAIEGYAPRLDKCLSCGKEKWEGRVYISLNRGGVVCAGCIGEDEFAKIAHDIKAGKEAAEVIISFASYHLGLPRHLKSFKFLESLTT